MFLQRNMQRLWRNPAGWLPALRIMIRWLRQLAREAEIIWEKRSVGSWRKQYPEENLCLQTGMTGTGFQSRRNRETLYSQIMQPIISAGDAVGSVILMGKNEKDVMGESEKMLIQTATGFLGRQMEQ